ncbi:MAG: pantetheine-phosphate adenylyltransferase [Clostridiales bacterium]|nr:pantetheine-phosphate adenylyltransferase [Clostridiales bacterium]
MKRIAIYPGSFDPVTNGHIDIIRRAAGIFDLLVVGVLNNSVKKATFTVRERVQMLNTTVALPNVEIKSFSGLLVDFVQENKAIAIIKGLRAVSDFEYECQMALINKKMLPACDTFFMPTAQEYSFLSSGIVKEMARYGGSLKGLVPECLERVIAEKCAISRSEVQKPSLP